MDSERLRTLLAVVDAGSFEAAATALRVTPSAVSQRIRALENEIGQVVVQRTIPVLPTEPGALLLRHARRMATLEQEVQRDLGLGATRTDLAVAVNADSLDTWFAAVLARAAAWDDVMLRLRVDDQDHTRDLLRAGAVLAGITSVDDVVGGCRSVPLGVMRYVPAAAPHLRDAHHRGRGVDWEAMPAVRFNAKDDLEARHLRRSGASLGPVHEVPSPAAYLEAVRAGLGWGLLPVLQAAPLLAAGEVVRLGRGVEDVPLHWQVWRMGSPRLDRLTETVVDVAHRALRRVS